MCQWRPSNQPLAPPGEEGSGSSFTPAPKHHSSQGVTHGLYFFFNGCMVPPARAVHPHKAGILGRSAPRPEVTDPPATHAAGETRKDRPSPSQASKGQNSILRERNCRKKKSFKRQSFTKGETSTTKKQVLSAKDQSKKNIALKKPKTNKKTTLRKRVQTSKCFHGVGGRVSHLACSAWGVGVGAVRQSGGGGRRSHPTMPIGLKCNRLEM